MAQCVPGVLQCLMALQRPHIFGAGCSQDLKWVQTAFITKLEATNQEELTEEECYDSETQPRD